MALPHPTLHSFQDAERNFDALDSRAVTALPPQPLDGQTIDFIADTTNGIVWRLRYRAGSSSAFKWEFVGGTALRDDDASTQSTSSTTFQTAGTSSVTAPLAGDYDVSFGATLAQNKAAVTNQMELSLFVGGVQNVTSFVIATAQFVGSPIERRQRVNGAAAGAALNPRYRSQAGQSSDFRGMYVAITPVRVG